VDRDRRGMKTGLFCQAFYSKKRSKVNKLGLKRESLCYNLMQGFTE
jgi:hypothetical protein